MSDERTIPSFNDRLWSEEVGMADPGANFDAPPTLSYRFGLRTLSSDVNTTLYAPAAAPPPAPDPVSVSASAAQVQQVLGVLDASTPILAGVSGVQVQRSRAAVLTATVGVSSDSVIQASQRQGAAASAALAADSGLTSAQAQHAAGVFGNTLVETGQTGQAQHVAALLAAGVTATLHASQAQHASASATSALSATLRASQGQRCVAAAAVSGAGTGTTSVSYSASTADFSNPERGFYVHLLHGGDFSSSNLNPYKAQHMSLVLYQTYLTAYRSSALDGTYLAAFQANLNSIRSNGMKTVLRFAYTETDTVDAPLSRIQGHLDQLAPYLAANSDIVLGMQCGFVGQWGEFQGSTNFGADSWPPNLSSTDKANRKAVIDKALAVMPAGRFVAVRQPWIKIQFYGATPVSAGTAFGTSATARVGHFNDCFLSGPDDSGTYYQQTSEESFLAQDTLYVPIGGETCNFNEPRSSGATAISEMTRFHWSFINSGYQDQVIQSWKNSGDYTTISKNLGYRLRLTAGAYPGSAARGATLNFTLNLTNDGFAAPFAARTAKLVLRNTVSHAETVLPLAVDPRTWLPGAHSVSEGVVLPAGMAAGSYALLLALPDAAGALATNPAYAIQLANSGVWESGTGYNDLGYTLTVT